MDASSFLSLLEDLEENIDDLEENLAPLLTTALSTTTKKLPLLDRAKLHTLLVYSIESLLFSYIRLNGISAKDHAVFKELTRVKQYFQKIKAAEDGQTPARPTISLNKQAMGRFIKQALAGNDRYDTERAEREAKEKLLAARKARAVVTPRPEKPVSQAEMSNSSEQNDHLEDGELDEDKDEMVDAPAQEPRMGEQQRTSKKRRENRRTPKSKNGVMKSKKEKKKIRKQGFEGDEEQEFVEPG